MPRGQALVQLKMVWQVQTPWASAQDAQPLARTLVAGIEDEAMRLDDGLRPNITGIGP